ncbi:MAG TPA: propionate--CoA ligase, partial [Burkholderiaceae bacterium]
MTYTDFYRRSIADRDAFWAEQATLIDWKTPFSEVCDYSKPPFARWFVGGTTNLCHNAVDRHLAARADQNALIWVSTEVGREQVYSFGQLHDEVQRMAAILLSLGVQTGDRVLIYMPMIPEAVFAMLACARIGAIHSVVFGGFASVSLASRIDDAEPKLIVSADAGSRAGKVVPYKALLDEAIHLAAHKPAKVLLVDRGLAPMARVSGRDADYAPLREQFLEANVPCTWVESNQPSYTLYTSGTTGKPKGVQRDTGGHAVALAASMKHIFCGQAGETYFSTSDIGWVVGHSYIVYGPLIAGMATILYEGLPVRPDAAIWWSLVEKYKVSVMFSAPTAVRVLKKQDAEALKRHDLSSLRALFLAGEPLDETTAKWIAEALGKPVVDNYWQTETGWPILTIANGVERAPSKFGSPGVPMYGFDVKLLDESTGEELTGANRKGVVAIQGPLPPGCMQTVWRDDARFVKTYWDSIPGRLVYSTFDWGIRDEDGYYFILGRTDDVINVAGHRLGTREIEESISSHPNVAEVAVVGVADPLKGQVAMAFAILKDPSKAASPADALKHEGEIMKLVDE